MNNMNTKILFLALSVAALTSCSTAYKMGQTPDDVYYSPAKVRAEVQQDDYVSTGNQPQRYTGAQSRNAYDSYEDFDSYRNDRFLRMSVGSTLRMGAFNDYYMYDGYSNWKYNNYAYNTNSPWNSYYYWNSYYNPYNTFNFYNPYYGGGYYGGGYGGGVVIIDKGNSSPRSVSRPGTFAPSSYTNNNYSNSNLYLYRNATSTSRPGTVNYGSRYNNTNSGNNTMRRLPATGNTYYNTKSNNRSLNNSNSNNNSYSAPRNTNTYEAPTRSYTPSSSPSSSGSSSSGSSSGGGGGVSRPSRGN